MWPFNSPYHETIRNHRTCVRVCTPAKGELQCLGDGHQFKYLNLSLETVQVFYIHVGSFFVAFDLHCKTFKIKSFFSPNTNFFSLSNKTRNCVLFCVWNLLSLTRKWRVKPLNPRTFTIRDHEHVVGLASKWASDFSLVLKYFYPLSWQDFQTQTMYKLYIHSQLTYIYRLFAALWFSKLFKLSGVVVLVCVCCSCALCWLITFNR